LCHEEHELGYQNERNKTKVLAIDTSVNQYLRQEGKCQLKQTAQQHSQQEHDNLAAVGLEVLEEEAKALLMALALLLALAEVHTWHHQQSHTAFLSLHLRTEPTVYELLLRVAKLLRGWVGDVEVIAAASVFLHLVTDHEMVLVPVEDARKGYIVGKLVYGYPHTERAKPQVLGCLADAQHRHPVSGDVAMLAQHLCRVLLAIVLGYHPQRGGTTVHLVELLIMGERFEKTHILILT